MKKVRLLNSKYAVRKVLDIPSNLNVDIIVYNGVHYYRTAGDWYNEAVVLVIAK